MQEYNYGAFHYSGNVVANQVKTTNPKKYSVRPNNGIVLPRSGSSVTVTMQAQREAPPDRQCNDKFLVQCVVAPPGVTTPKDINPEMFNKEAGNHVEECKLKVVYVHRPRPPSPVPEESEEETPESTSTVSRGYAETRDASSQSLCDALELTYSSISLVARQGRGRHVNLVNGEFRDEQYDEIQELQRQVERLTIKVEHQVTRSEPGELSYARYSDKECSENSFTNAREKDWAGRFDRDLESVVVTPFTMILKQEDEWESPPIFDEYSDDGFIIPRKHPSNKTKILEVTNKSFHLEDYGSLEKAKALISTLTKEIQSITQENNKLHQELELLRRGQRRNRGGVSVYYVLLIGLLGIFLGYYMRNT